MENKQLERQVEKAIAQIKAEIYFSKENLQRVIDVAEKKALEIDVPVTICISDISGHPRMFYHMPDANIVSITLAPKKANSAIMLGKPTKDVNRDTVPGGELYQMENMMNGELVTFAGGIPLESNGHIVGAIGVSGGLVDEDHLICETAVKSFFKGE